MMMMMKGCLVLKVSMLVKLRPTLKKIAWNGCTRFILIPFLIVREWRTWSVMHGGASEATDFESSITAVCYYWAISLD